MAAPEATNVVLPPRQMAFRLGVIITVGKALMLTVRVAVLAQPKALVPVTVYVVVFKGATKSEAVVTLLVHKYVLAPLAVSVALWPAHRVTDAGEMLITGSGFTVTSFIAVEVQPLTDVPVTV